MQNSVRLTSRLGYEDIRGARRGQDARLELADVRRLARRLMRRAVMAARADDEPARQLLVDHLGPGSSEVPIASGSWPGYDAVNVQAGLDAWLATAGREHELFGITGFHDMSFGLADLIQPGGEGSYLGVGSVAAPARSDPFIGADAVIRKPPGDR